MNMNRKWGFLIQNLLPDSQTEVQFCHFERVPVMIFGVVISQTELCRGQAILSYRQARFVVKTLQTSVLPPVYQNTPSGEV